MDTADALMKAGSPGGSVSEILAVGKSDKVLVTDTVRRQPFGEPARSTSFLLSVKSGAVVAEPLPQVVATRPFGDVVADSEGQPWVTVTRQSPEGYAALASCRITPAGAVDFLYGGTWRLDDAAGNLWMIMGWEGAAGRDAPA